MRDYCITGGWGKLGTELTGTLSAWVPTKQELNILEPSGIKKYLESHSAGSILHLAAMSDTKLAESDTKRSYLVNVTGTANMAEAARQQGKRLIYISTDYVFPGTTGDYKESDEPNPSNWYGFTKYAGEIEIERRLSDHLIIRTAFRPKVWPFSSAYADVYTTGDYVDIIAKEILHALALNLSGIIHIGTPKKSLYDLAKQRNPAIVAEPSPAGFPKRKDLSIEKWERLKLKNQTL